MHAVHLPALAGAIVLVASGLTKLRRPVPAARALRAVLRAGAAPAAVVRLASSFAAARALGATEAVIGAAVLATPWVAATWALAAMYAAFAVFVVVALRTGAPVTSCGCFGAADAPPSARHVALDAAVGAFAVLAAVDDAGAPRATLGASNGLGAGAALVGAVVLWFVLRGSVTRPPRRADPATPPLDSRA